MGTNFKEWTELAGVCNTGEEEVHVFGKVNDNDVVQVAYRTYMGIDVAELPIPSGQVISLIDSGRSIDEISNDAYRKLGDDFEVAVLVEIDGEEMFAAIDSAGYLKIPNADIESDINIDSYEPGEADDTIERLMYL